MPSIKSKAIQGLIRYGTQSPPSPTVQAVNQLIKGCEIAMQSAVLLAAENKKLRAGNENIKKKRQKNKSYIGRGGVLSAQEVQEAQMEVGNRGEDEIQVVEQPSQPSSLRAPRMCSICRSLAHNARTCPDR